MGKAGRRTTEGDVAVQDEERGVGIRIGAVGIEIGWVVIELVQICGLVCERVTFRSEGGPGKPGRAGGGKRITVVGGIGEARAGVDGGDVDRVPGGGME